MKECKRSVTLLAALCLILAGCSARGPSHRVAALSAKERVDASAAASPAAFGEQAAARFCADGTIAGAHVLTHTFHVADLAGENGLSAELDQDGLGADLSDLGPVVYNAWVTYSLAFLGVGQDLLPTQVRMACTEYVKGPGFEPAELALLCRWDDSSPVCIDPSLAPSAAGMPRCDIGFAVYVKDHAEGPVTLRSSHVTAWGCAGPYVQLEVKRTSGEAGGEGAIYDLSARRGGIFAGVATPISLDSCAAIPAASLAALASQVAVPEKPC